MASYTTLRFGDEARNKVLQGARTLADAVRVTLGPLAVLDTLRTSARPVETREAKAQVATVSALLRDVLDVPARQLAINAGVDPGVAVERIRAEAGLGLDADALEYRDMIAAGIVDAVKVVRTGLENAVSIAGTMLLAEATLTEHEDRNADNAVAPEL